MQDAYQINPCVLMGPEAAAIFNQGFGGRALWGNNRWHAAYVLLAMYGFWALVLIGVLVMRCAPHECLLDHRQSMANRLMLSLIEGLQADGRAELLCTHPHQLANQHHTQTRPVGCAHSTMAAPR